MRLRCLVLVLVLLGAPAHAQRPVPPAWIVEVDRVFSEYGAETPGCAVGVYRAGEIVFAKGYGLADVERLVPITSGLRDYINLLTLAGYSTDDVTRDEDALAIVTRQRALNFAPGTDRLYSNSGYFLVSVIVERVAGMPLREFARARIFAPLGMTRTHVLHRTSDLVRDRAQAYSARRDGTLGLDLSRWEQTGDGAVWTTIDELARWDANFYTGSVGGQPMLDTLQTPGTLADGRPLPMAYGLGLMLGSYRGQPTVRHGGSWSGFRADLLRFPSLALHFTRDSAGLVTGYTLDGGRVRGLSFTRLP